MDEHGKEQAYSVGYKKPPQHTQFKPGQSGNPRGRPKKALTINEVFLKALQTRVSITTPSGRRRSISLLQLMAKQYSSRAANGDYRAARLVLEQVNSGKPLTGDNLENLIQEFRAANARHESDEDDRPPSGKGKRQE